MPSSRCQIPAERWARARIYLTTLRNEGIFRENTLTSSSMSLVSVNLATIVIQSCLYGLFMILNAVSMINHFVPLPEGRTARQRSQMIVKHILKVSWGPTFLGKVLLLLIATAHWLCTVIRLFDAILHFRGGPLEYYADFTQSTYVAKESLILASIIVGDGMIIHRSWIIWGRRYIIIILPTVLLISLIASGIWATNHLRGEERDKGKWRIAYALLVMLTNLSAASLMTWRIWSTTRKSESLGVYIDGAVDIKTVPSLILEGTGIYTIWSIFYGVSLLIESDIREFAADTLPVVAGIAWAAIRARYAWVRRPGEIRENRGRSSSYPMRRFSFRVAADRNPQSSLEPISFPDPHATSERDLHSKRKRSVDILPSEGPSRSDL
ncbi:hypothetical protein PM082_016103 [Marasmius tenuissimus]|nr:hypothetical protein PM082_016103 [Marasmius tenuissimus]